MTAKKIRENSKDMFIVFVTAFVNYTIAETIPEIMEIQGTMETIPAAMKNRETAEMIPEMRKLRRKKLLL